MTRVTAIGILGLVTGGLYLAWRNRFALQRQVESLGIRTPLLSGSLVEAAQTVAAEAGGHFGKGSTLAESALVHWEQDERLRGSAG